MGIAYQYGQRVAVSKEMVADTRWSPLNDITGLLADAVRESMLDATDGPRFGPRRVLNDSEQAEQERRQALAEIVLDLADEWGVTDLVSGDEW